MRKIKKFFKDKWKIILGIIIILTFLYSLIFDGSEIPCTIAFISYFAIPFLKNVKNTIIYIKNFRYLKKIGILKNMNNSRKFYKQCRDTIHESIISVLVSGGLLACMIFAFTWR
ncbi:MAG: hypothetical protein K2H28_01240 [Ruminococcus sp.]|nr:hypothetical protein [Ruminococcus sp.]